MKNRTVTVSLRARSEEVFDFLANPENLPLWAARFCESVCTENGRWRIVTAQGEYGLAIDANRAAGCIDVYYGPTVETMQLFPIRILKLEAGLVAVVFSLLRAAEPCIVDATYQKRYRLLVEAAKAVGERFGGGEISAEWCVGNLYPSFVTENLASVKRFYTAHFGFLMVFDAPFYLHLAHPESGQQLGFMSCESEGSGSHRQFERAADGFGYWISIATDSVDEDYERLKSAGVPVNETPKNQVWGERTCIVKDPNGTLIYLSQKLPTMDESLARYVVPSYRAPEGQKKSPTR